jgi:hypothetical protein
LSETSSIKTTNVRTNTTNRQPSFNSLLEASKKDGDVAIARREIYYILERVKRGLPIGCVGSDVCGLDGTCFTQVSGKGYCK